MFPKDGVAFEAYYNPDSNAGGQFVFNCFTFKAILNAEEYAKGNPSVFFMYTDAFCTQELIDITEDIETLEDAAAQFNDKADYVGHSKETMDALVKVAHEAREKAPVQNHKSQQER